MIGSGRDPRRTCMRGADTHAVHSGAGDTEHTEECSAEHQHGANVTADGGRRNQPRDESLSDIPRQARVVTVPWRRIPGWIERYEARHPATTWTVSPSVVTAQSADGSTASFGVPVAPLVEPTLPRLLEHLARKWQIGIVLVRRGGFAVARLVGDDIVESKVGQRHVQGRTKAGGWSQQRFARRRDNQARVAFAAAASYVQALLLPAAGSLDLLAAGGDRSAAEAVFEAPELAPLRVVPQLWLAGLGDPRRSVLDRAVGMVRSVDVEIVDTAPRIGDRGSRG